MAYNDRAYFETLRSESTIGAAYTALGSPYTNPIVVVTFKNNTNGDVVISDDGVNDKLVFPAGSYTVYDIRTNAPRDTNLTLPINLQFYIKDGATPSTSGTFYVEAVGLRNTP